MSKQKGKEKGGQKRKTVGATVEETEKLTEVDRTFYDLTIQDAKKKILTLRTHIQNLLVSNDNIENELRAMTDGKVNNSVKVEKEINEIEDQIVGLKSENAMLTKVFNTKKSKTDETISDLELKYKAMHDQLCADIKRLNGRLHACEELRENWDNWMIKYAERADVIAGKKKEAENILQQIEKKTVFENDDLKEELLEKLTLAGEQFSGEGATNSSDFNMRLIRENIALQKNIDLLTNSNNEMDSRMEQELELYKSNKADIPKLEKRNAELVLMSQNKITMIKKLTDQIEDLKKEYASLISYREQNISLKEFQMCARYRRRKLRKVVYNVGKKINSVTQEINLYDYLIDQYKQETREIAHHLENLRSTIERSILLREQESVTSKTSLDTILKLKRERNDMLGIFLELLRIDFDVLDTGKRASIESIGGYDKLIRFDDLFKKEAPSLSSLMDAMVTHIDSDKGDASSSVTVGLKYDTERDSIEYRPITPAQRPFGRNYIFDVESGTSLYFSSSRGDPERDLLEKQAAAGENEEEEASSESWSNASDTKTKEKETTQVAATEQTSIAKSIQSKITSQPPGTIVDVVSEDEFEEDIVFEEYVEENEEYDINLFY